MSVCCVDGFTRQSSLRDALSLLGDAVKSLIGFGGITPCNGSLRPRLSLLKNHLKRQQLRISSSCRGSRMGVARPCNLQEELYGYSDGVTAGKSFTEIAWKGFCACCKRPLIITLAEQPAASPEERCVRGKSARYAYVVALWGSSPEYVLGAMVLAWSLRQTETRHDLVALHTGDVAPGALELLERSGWLLRVVEYVDATPNLSHDACLRMRFARVFTKLRVLGLVEYEKVLMLDIDLLVRENIDDLFELPAPAAMVRGPKTGYEHGGAVDGSYFFAGSRPGLRNSWGQSNGINAGVMLLKPDAETLHHCLAEVADDTHPEHIRGNGPEQDYLSRFYAADWCHISVAYNFQLHQMYFALHPGGPEADRKEFLHHPERIKVYHYSCEPKPWMRYLDEHYHTWSDVEWLEEILRGFRGYRAWVMGDPVELQNEAQYGGYVLGPDCRVHKIDWERVRRFDAHDPETTGPMSDDGWPLGEVIEAAEMDVTAAYEVARHSQEIWFKAYSALATELRIPDLAAAVKSTSTKSEPEETGSAEEPGDIAIGWSNATGWWVQGPLAAKAVASCGVLPQTYVVLSIGGKVLLDAKSTGVHVAATALVAADAQCPAPQTFEGGECQEEVARWVEAVPSGATVLLAIVDTARDGAQRPRYFSILETMKEAGLGGPCALPPLGCAVAAGIGLKGENTWHSTHAAADVALATSRVLQPWSDGTVGGG